MSMSMGITPIRHTPTMGLLYFFKRINKPFFGIFLAIFMAKYEVLAE